MKEITRTKKFEVANYYLLGYTYRQIEHETGISHGSIANIVSEIENGDLVIPGTSFDKVNDLHQLSLDLKKNNLTSSQAVLGITFLKRIQDLQVSLEQIDVWSELTRKLSTPDFPADQFFEAASRLRELETSHGIPFDVLVEEYRRRQGEV